MGITGKSNKLIVSLLTTFALVFCAFSTAFANDTVTLSISSATITPDETAEIGIEVSNLKTLSNLSFFVEFDSSAFELTKSNITVEDTLLKGNGTIALGADVHGDGKRLAAIGGDNRAHEVGMIEKTTIITARFKPKSGIKPGKYDLSFNRVEIESLDSSGNTIKLTVNKLNGSITVQEKSGGTGGGGTGGGNKYIPVIPEPKEQDETPKTEVVGAEKFADLDGFEWAVESIDALVKAGIVNGVTETAYEPGRSITRAEFCKLISTAFGFDEVDELTAFTDVSNDDWFYAPVMAAAKAGIVTGYPEGNFLPAAEISREETAVMLIRALKATGIEIPQGEMTFADFSEMGDWAVDSIASLVQMGIVNGKGDNKFAPKDNLTRAEAAKVIHFSITL
ncbi:MAG: S-layer homology domain-containing protein [Firmicutes bacterium]|nr:S-layer homology domain-containing protein [Bacillota bacterium]